MKLLDTNVVMYAIGRPHRYKRACGLILGAAAEGAGAFNVDTELLHEVLYVYASRGQRPIGLDVCSRLLQLFPSPYPITREEIVLAHDLMARQASLSPRDAIHAAVVKSNRLDGIVSADEVFDEITEIKRFDPISLFPEEA